MHDLLERDRSIAQVDVNRASGRESSPFQMSGLVEKIVFRDETSGMSYLLVSFATKQKMVVKGYTYAGIGQKVHVSGMRVWNQKYQSYQVEAESIIATDPVTKQGAIDYLSSGIVKGVGKKTAEKIVRHFGIEVFAILDEDPSRICEVPGIGAQKGNNLAKAWAERKAINEIMLFLRSQGISEAYSRRIFSVYGDKAIEQISRDPYALCRDVRGIGFKIADRIAMKLGVPKESKQRIRAGIVFVLGEGQKTGHTGLALKRFLELGANALEVDRSLISSVLDEMLNESPKRVCMHDGIVFSEWLARFEEDIAAFLRDRGASTCKSVKNLDEIITEEEKKAGFSLTPLQRKAVETAVSCRAMVLTGGPGCGKTSTLAIMLAVFRRLGLSISVAAPTGKAAQRAKEATGMEAYTVHRLLRLTSDFDDPLPVETDVLVVDEMSMVDVPLMNKIIRAVGSRVKTVFVGDSDQLPSVGPGSVLRDIIGSGAIPVVRLDKIFRQAEGSLIITNAHAIRQGNPVMSGGTASDFWILDERNYPPLMRAMIETPEEERPAAIAETAADAIMRLALERIPERINADPARDIWVLSPMNEGACGVKRMNDLLRAAINPSPAKKVTRYGMTFGVGDRVIQTRNNYDLGIFNGDSGFVFDLDAEEELLAVEFDGGRRVRIPFDDLDDLKLSYAITIHKSQGSQMPVVIIPVVTQHYMMLQRNVLYTGITRAKRLVVLVGVSNALRMAINNTRNLERITRMGQIFGVC